MKKKSTGNIIIVILGLLGLGYSAYRLLSIKKAFRKPIVDISKVGSIKYKDGFINLYFDAKVENPNSIKVFVNAIDLTVYDAKENRLGSVTNFKINTTVNPKSTTTIKDIRVKIGVFEVFSFLISDTSKKTYTIIGEVKVENYTIPINHIITV